MPLPLISRQSRWRWHHEWHRAGLGWQQNMTVFGSGGTMPIFPLGCIALMPAIRSLVIVILIGLVFHGLASQTAARSGDRPHGKALEGCGPTLAMRIRWRSNAFSGLRRLRARFLQPEDPTTSEMSFLRSFPDD
jgi:hypothetical protein